MSSVLALVCCLFLVGCGETDEYSRFHVSGTVTYDGVSVPFGQIVFEPDMASGNSGPQGVADIRNGKFDTSQSRSKGVTGGKMRVLITGSAGEGGDEFNPQPLLFPEYSVIQEISKESRTLNFNIPKDTAP